MTGSSRQTEAGVASGVTTVPADNRAGKPRSSAALLFLAIVIAAVVIDLALYRRSQPDLGSGAVDQPSWALVAALASVSVLGLVRAGMETGP